uniref:Uncharacterized protein n=1 Tax=Strongyloides venezuelensis TaxID=75913 RepID=A0A0K0FQZ5_STRVS
MFGDFLQCFDTNESDSGHGPRKMFFQSLGNEGIISNKKNIFSDNESKISNNKEVKTSIDNEGKTSTNNGDVETAIKATNSQLNEGSFDIWTFLNLLYAIPSGNKTFLNDKKLNGSDSSSDLIIKRKFNGKMFLRK